MNRSYSEGAKRYLCLSVDTLKQRPGLLPAFVILGLTRQSRIERLAIGGPEMTDLQSHRIGEDVGLACRNARHDMLGGVFWRGLIHRDVLGQISIDRARIDAEHLDA
jgi:hypothetical protein